MKKFRKILKWLLVAIGVPLGAYAAVWAFLVVEYVLAATVFYEREMNQIRDGLNKLEGVEVVDIWSDNLDVTMEHVAARVRIEGKGEIVLTNLNSRDRRYPKRVGVREIGGYSFRSYHHDGGIGQGINIGTEGELGRMIGKTFKTPKDVLASYDAILAAVESLKAAPEANHFETEDAEWYLLIEKRRYDDHYGLEETMRRDGEFVRSVKWNRGDSRYNRPPNPELGRDTPEASE